MDCHQVRQQILEGKAGHWAVRHHLRRCASCSAFQGQWARAEEMLAEAIPFTAPVSLSERLQGMVPQAAQQLRAAHQEMRGATRAAVRRILYGLCLLAVPASLWVGYMLWRLGLERILAQAGDPASLLPLLPSAILYWGGRGFAALAPLREALLFAATILLLGIALDQVRHSRPTQPACGTHRDRVSS